MFAWWLKRDPSKTPAGLLIGEYWERPIEGRKDEIGFCSRPGLNSF